MGSELWFREFERHLNDLEDEGIPFNVAYEKAAGMAERSVPERLADLIDQERQRRKDEGC